MVIRRVIWILLFLTASLFASTWYKQLKLFDQCQILDIVQKPDGSFLASGYVATLKNDSTVYTDSAALAASGCIVIKFDSLGDTLWTKTFLGPLGGIPIKSLLLQDGGLLITGGTNVGPVDDLGPSVWWVIRVDSTGNLVWKKTFGRTADAILEDAAAFDTGSFILAGEYDFDGVGARTSRFMVVRINGYGDTLWTKEISGIPWMSNKGFLHTINRTLDHGFALSYTLGGDTLSGVIGIDTLGTVVDANNIPGIGIEGHSFALDRFGNYVICGDSYALLSRPSVPGFFFAKALQNFSQLSLHTFGSNNYTTSNLQPTSDYHFLASGTEGSGSGSEHVFIAKFDSTGDTLWTRRRFAHSKIELAQVAKETIDKGVIIGGVLSSIAPIGGDVMFIAKTDSNGYSPFWDSQVSVLNNLRNRNIATSTQRHYLCLYNGFMDPHLSKSVRVIKLYNPRGRVVAHFPGGSYFDARTIRSLPKGLYILEITNNESR